MIDQVIQSALDEIKLPAPESHKGQNGKVLVIGGSDLFHAASKWSLDVASRLVDMVFYASTPSNNEMIQQAKSVFWNGIVISLDEVGEYITESDAILIGPGMTRTPDTQELTNRLLAAFPDKKWVLDAGALQMVDVGLLNANCILTPHQQELSGLLDRVESEHSQEEITLLSGQLGQATILVKGQSDQIINTDRSIKIPGGNAGMTKGGTGDVLAGLVAGLYANHDAWTAAVVASFINKTAGDELYQRVGPYFNASDLAQQVPVTLYRATQPSLFSESFAVESIFSQ